MLNLLSQLVLRKTPSRLKLYWDISMSGVEIYDPYHKD